MDANIIEDILDPTAEFQTEASSTSAYSGFGILPKRDIMSIVMKRRLGGCESSGNESDTSMSPVKKPRTEHENNTNDIVIDIGAAFTDIEEKGDSNENNAIYIDIDADFTTLDGNEEDGQTNESQPNDYIIAGGVEGFNVSNFESLHSDNQNSGSCDAFDTFSFSLNEKEDDLNPELEKHEETEFEEQNGDNKQTDSLGGQANDVTDNNSAKYFTIESLSSKLEAEPNIGQNYEKSQSESEVLSETTEETIHKESDNPSSFTTDILNNRSENLFMKRSDGDFNDVESSNSEIVNIETVQCDNGSGEKQTDLDCDSIDSCSAFENKDEKEGHQTTRNTCETLGIDSVQSESEQYKSASVCLPDTERVMADEVDSLNTFTPNVMNSKQAVKKSRKQKMPMHLPKNEMSFDCIPNVNETDSPASQTKKSRKGFKLKVAMKDQGEFDDSLDCYDDDGFDYEESFNEHVEDFEELESAFRNPENEKSSEKTKSIETNFHRDDHILDMKKSYGLGVSQTDDNMPVLKSDYFAEKDTPNFNLPPGLPDSFHNAFMSYANFFQPHLTNDLTVEKLFEHNQANLTENLEVVKKLREIRFNRYRKITVSEKREIAEYAKVNSVSSAALHYGVSKSAVSMWTRIDFTDMDDSGSRRKKNCMIGNPKFEELIQRVRDEKATKFKHLSREDKFEVSRYAKLVGVREMSRCLNIALGTVSGWMRQFPYLLKQSNPEDGGQEGTNAGDGSQNSNVEGKQNSEITVKTESNPEVDAIENEQNNMDKVEKGIYSAKSISSGDDDDGIKIKIERVDGSDYGVYDDQSNMHDAAFQQKPGNCSFKQAAVTRSSLKSDDNLNIKCEPVDIKTEDSQESVKDEDTSKVSGDKVDEIDEMIAETYEVPDVDKCFEIAKEMIKGSPLEDDTFFEKLFRRVVETRADKYKSLKASEKLEVVRYAKRIGVRRVAKILGLATGTLSGWTTKYQAHLGLTSDVLMDMSQANSSQLSELDSSLDTSQNASMLSGSQDTDSQSSPYFMSPASSVLDNPERAEVTAVKLILKDRFDFLKEKIGVARQIKFKNMTQDEKIEVVKCTKLAGIRPTARVLNMPIGTLSGWITKYTSNLHPVYQEECDRLDGQAIHRPTQSTYAMPGSQAYFMDIMNSQWPGLKHLPALYTHSDMSASPNTSSTQDNNTNIYKTNTHSFTNNTNIYNRSGSDSAFDNEKLLDNNSVQSFNILNGKNGAQSFHDIHNGAQPEVESQPDNERVDTEMYTKLEDNAMYVVRRPDLDLFCNSGSPVTGNEQSGTLLEKKSQNLQSVYGDVVKHSGNTDFGFEDEAKNLAAKYLQAYF